MLDIPESIKQLYRENNASPKTKRIIRMRFFDENVKLPYLSNVQISNKLLLSMGVDPFLTITNDQIVQETLIVSESLCESDTLIFGECNSSQVELIVADIKLELTGLEFLLSVEIGGYEISLGIYKVDSFIRQADRRLKKITAYDRMLQFDVDVAGWYKKLNFPMKLKDFRENLCTYVGIEQSAISLPLDDMQLSKTISPEKISGREVLQAICEINGCFGQIDRTGRLKYITLVRAGLFPSDDLYPSDILYPAEMIDPERIPYYNPSGTTYEDYVVFGIDKLQIRQEEGDIGVIVGEGSNTYTIQGNFLVYGKNSSELLQIAIEAFDNISGRLYRPCKIACPALPWLEPGDGVICYTTDDLIETYCLKRTLKGIQAMSDTIEADGSEFQEEDFGIMTQIIQLEGKAAVIKKSVDEVSVKVTNLKEFTETQLKITADQILAEVKRASEAEAALVIKADEISTSVSNLKTDTNSRFEQTDKKIELKVSIGDISSKLSVESDKITLSGNRLIVDSTNFKLDGSGNATFSGDIRGADIYGSAIFGGTIDIGDGTFLVDVDGSVNITSGEINIGNIHLNDNYAWLYGFGIASSVIYSHGSGEQVLISTSEYDGTGPSIELKKGKLSTRIGFGGMRTGEISCDEIYLSGQFWEGWSLTEEIELLHNTVFNK